jgi:hypothetical protein
MPAVRMAPTTPRLWVSCALMVATGCVGNIHGTTASGASTGASGGAGSSGTGVGTGVAGSGVIGAGTGGTTASCNAAAPDPARRRCGGSRRSST